jgi:hypothetical protein
MAIKGTLSRTASIGGRVSGGSNLRAKQVAIGTEVQTSISGKSINELSDVNSTATDDGLLSYDASTEKWTTTTTLDGGTF